jgi:hypothetical protein
MIALSGLDLLARPEMDRSFSLSIRFFLSDLVLPI